jgi:ADP-ribosylarginine hydrolase|uniref:ADP-ribosylglycohydrolase n=1 Tax=viral metagenome TaxID=1070528 RepID=A0A6C0EDN1_9ZZZZ
MTNLKEKIEASFMLASYFETLGFKNGLWEFNYNNNINSLTKYSLMWNIMIHHYLILGGANKINIKGWNSSDDTILIIDIIKSILDGGGEENYKKNFINSYDMLYENKRASGINTIRSIQILKTGKKININSDMGGNGAALRTSPIGIYWNNNIEKVIEESIISSLLTHNYYLGFLGGMVTAIFTSYAINNINPILWIDKLLDLYKNKIIHKYYPKNHNIEDLDDYMIYWNKYYETRMSKLIYKNTLDNFIYPEERTLYLLNFYPDKKIKNLILSNTSLKDLNWKWDLIASTGLDVCIYTYDCLLLSMYTPNNINLDYNNIKYNFDTFLTLVSIHPGDNDTTGAIGGAWFGALNGYHDFDKSRIKELEFFNELKTLSKKFYKKLKK